MKIQKNLFLAEKAESTLNRLSVFTSRLQGTSLGWHKIQEEYMLDAFKAAAKYVPAYRNFLKEHGVLARCIKTIKDFAQVPPVSKKNYLKKYPWNDICMRGAISSQQLILTATSGSTGEPYYFPRTATIDEQSYLFHRIFLKGSGLDETEPTLVIVAFGMGVWIGGIITYEAFKRISERDFPLTILTPGVNKKEIYDALTEIGGNYTQLVLCGYPPFIKDIIDDGPENGINWNSFDMRIVCAAESFSEEFRTYLMKKAGMHNRYRDIMNIYGSAELGTMAMETPISILIRELSLERPSLFRKLFMDASRLPTLAQYIPSFVSFEAVDNRILCTAGNVMPLIRYDIGDHGGVLKFSEVSRICASEGVDLKATANKAGIQDALELPFVYVYERADLSAKLYGAIIYPEHIKAGLMKRGLHNSVTNRFIMSTKTDEKQNEYLEIVVELKKNVKEQDSLRSKIRDRIVASLSERNAEHKNNMKALGEKVAPKIVLSSYGNPRYFSSGTKHRWISK